VKSPSRGKTQRKSKNKKKLKNGEEKAKIKEELMCIRRRQSNNRWGFLLPWLFCFLLFYMAGGKSANKRLLRATLNKDVKNVRHC